MKIFEAIKKRRTIRRFAGKKIPFKALEKCVEAARLGPSARNLQPLEFIVVHEKEAVLKLNALVNFGGIVKEQGRKQGEEATAFIVVLLNKERGYEHSSSDIGIAVQSICLAGFEQGIGSCIMGSIEREKIKLLLEIPEHCDIALAIALGYPKEKPVLEESNETQYWVDSEGNLHVPKRSLKSILHREKY